MYYVAQRKKETRRVSSAILQKDVIRGQFPAHSDNDDLRSKYPPTTTTTTTTTTMFSRNNNNNDIPVPSGRRAFPFTHSQQDRQHHHHQQHQQPPSTSSRRTRRLTTSSLHSLALFCACAFILSTWSSSTLPVMAYSSRSSSRSSSSSMYRDAGSHACPKECICQGPHVDCSHRRLSSVPRGLPTDAEKIDFQVCMYTHLCRTSVYSVTPDLT